MSNASNETATELPPRLPASYQRWHLYGAGLENVGREGKPETVELPTPAPNEILVRHDACGICYSDIKIINLGDQHPRLVGRDLAQNPVVMGHEVALTVVGVGEDLREQFHEGERYIVQADVYYQGVNLAYGYAITGGMSQYGIIGPEVLQGDEGCYLLPIQPETGSVEAALVEPWACVEAAYHWTERSDVLPGGCLAALDREGVKEAYYQNVCGKREQCWTWHSVETLSDKPRFEDILIESRPTPELFEAVCARLDKNGTAHLHFSDPIIRPVAVDVGRIHYDGHRYVGPKENKRNELKAGGTAWFIGAAGPMGQMHVQRALSLPNSPARLVCTDRQAGRIAALVERFGPMAKERGVELFVFNVRENGPPDFANLAPSGFDDIVIMVPSIEAIEDAFPRLAEDGVLNVFAGVARGTMARLDISLVAIRNVRIVGTSGSSIEDMRRVRDAMESGQLNTGASLAAIGGLEAFRGGLEAVQNGRFPGKTVIFPHVPNLPLTALPDLATVRPDVYAKLQNGEWTRDAEAVLLND